MHLQLICLMVSSDLGLTTPLLYSALIDRDSRKKRVRNAHLFNTCSFKPTVSREDSKEAKQN